MDICIIVDKPETRDPGITLLYEHLSGKHIVRQLLVTETEEAFAETIIAEHGPLADLYLLTTRCLPAIEVGRSLEQRGVQVINSVAATEICQDRTLLTDYLQRAKIAWPKTWSFASLHQLLADQQFLATFTFPGILKSNRSKLGDLVKQVNGLEEIQALAGEWGEEPVILQEFIPGDGWDIKTWAFGPQIFAARRRSPLEARSRKQQFQLDADEIPQAWRDLVLAVGQALDIQVYGVDLLVTKQGPLAVDVNAFHSCYGVIGSDRALVDLVEACVYVTNP